MVFECLQKDVKQINIMSKSLKSALSYKIIFFDLYIPSLKITKSDYFLN